MSGNKQTASASSKNAPPRKVRFKLLGLSQLLATALSPLLALNAYAEPVGPLPPPPIEINPSSTIIPTDVVPFPQAQERMNFGENMQLRILQKLPSKFYFNVTAENSWRYETNPFQFPTKRKLLSQIYQTTPPFDIAQLDEGNQAQILNTVNEASNDDWIYRILPNITAGWALTSKTRIYSNYFMIRDYLYNNKRLNTVIQSVSGGIQKDFAISRRSNLQADFQFRELYQEGIQSQFDFLPGLTYSYIATPRTVIFVNALLQMRGKNYFQAPTKEIDPFYTGGVMYQKGPWSFSNTVTFVQNFRNPFKGNALIPVNNYSFICDFEIAKRLVKWLPGLQGFVRAEPFWNFHSHNTPGLAGFDFRFFMGMRMSLGKPPLTQALEQIREQLEEQEGAPTPTPNPAPPTEPKPSAFIMPYQVIADSPQPIHGFLNDAAANTISFAQHQESPIVAPATPIASTTPTVTAPAVISLASTPASTTNSANNDVVSVPAADIFKSVSFEQPAYDIATSKTSEFISSAVDDLSNKSNTVTATPNQNLIAAQPVDVVSPLKPAIDVRSVASAVESAKQKENRHHRNKRQKSESNRIVANRPSEVQMVLLPPLPSVDSQSKEPFASSGIDVTPPQTLNVVH